MKPDQATSLACNAILLSQLPRIKNEWKCMNGNCSNIVSSIHGNWHGWRFLRQQWRVAVVERKKERLNNAWDEREFFIHWYRWKFGDERGLDMDISEIINSDYVTRSRTFIKYSAASWNAVVVKALSTKCLNWHIYWQVMKTWEFLLAQNLSMTRFACHGLPVLWENKKIMCDEFRGNLIIPFTTRGIQQHQNNMFTTKCVCVELKGTQKFNLTLV